MMEGSSSKHCYGELFHFNQLEFDFYVGSNVRRMVLAFVITAYIYFCLNQISKNKYGEVVHYVISTNKFWKEKITTNL